MKRILVLIMMLAVLAACMLAPVCAQAVPSGTTARTVTFKVTAQRADARCWLTSNTGVASVAQHNIFGRYTRDKNETIHGFYRVTVKAKNYNKSKIWGPSATTNKSRLMPCKSIYINLPKKGTTYTVTVAPLSFSEAKQFWRMNFIRKWVRNASWSLCKLDGCFTTN